MTSDLNISPDADLSKEAELQAKTEELMADMAETALPAEVIKEIEDKVKRIFKRSGLTFTRPNVRAFLDGALYMLSLDGIPNSQAFRPIAPGVVKLILRRLERDIAERKKKLTDN